MPNDRTTDSLVNIWAEKEKVGEVQSKKTLNNTIMAGTNVSTNRVVTSISAKRSNKDTSDDQEENSINDGMTKAIKRQRGRPRKIRDI